MTAKDKEYQAWIKLWEFAKSSINNGDISYTEFVESGREIFEVKLKQSNPKVTIEQRKENFAHTIYPYKDQYGSEMCLQFFNYWSELNHSGKKMRFELQKTWEVGKRLATWQNNSKTFSNGKRNELDTLEQQLLAKFGG